MSVFAHTLRAHTLLVFFVACIALVSAFFLLLPEFAFAQPEDVLGLNYGEETGLVDTDPRVVAAQVISLVLGVLGIVTLILIIYAGFRWMTSGGNEENVSKAKGILFAAVIGLIIILMAYALTRYVLQELYQATAGNPYGTPTSGLGF